MKVQFNTTQTAQFVAEFHSRQFLQVAVVHDSRCVSGTLSRFCNTRLERVEPKQIERLDELLR